MRSVLFITMRRISKIRTQMIKMLITVPSFTSLRLLSITQSTQVMSIKLRSTTRLSITKLPFTTTLSFTMANKCTKMLKTTHRILMITTCITSSMRITKQITQPSLMSPITTRIPHMVEFTMKQLSIRWNIASLSTTNLWYTTNTHMNRRSLPRITPHPMFSIIHKSITSLHPLPNTINKTTTMKS